MSEGADKPPAHESIQHGPLRRAARATDRWKDGQMKKAEEFQAADRDPEEFLDEGAELPDKRLKVRHIFDTSYKMGEACITTFEQEAAPDLTPQEIAATSWADGFITGLHYAAQNLDQIEQSE